MKYYSKNEVEAIVRATAIAAMAHMHQLYGNQLYIMHPIAVADNIANATATEYIAALLHDTIEDTDVNEEYIRSEFGHAVADIVTIVTKNNKFNYKQNIQKIIDSGNYSAMRVKLSDIEMNYSNDKSHMSEKRRARLNDQYTIGKIMLIEAIENYMLNELR